MIQDMNVVGKMNKIIKYPTKNSAGKAIHNGLIVHYIKGKWVACGDCNPQWKLKQKWRYK